jgi:hypothetical protein
MEKQKLLILTRRGFVSLVLLILAGYRPLPAWFSAPLPVAKERPEPSLSDIEFPRDVQLLSPDTDPVLRIPIAHFTQTMSVGPMSNLHGGFGWLEISRKTVRYTAMEQLHVGHYGSATKETDIGFEYARSDLTQLRMLYRSIAYPVPDQTVQTHLQDKEKVREYFAYYAKAHWPLDRHGMDQMQKVDAVYTPLILLALEDFDAVVTEFKRRHPSPAPAAVAVAKPEPPPAPSLVLLAPANASDNAVVEVNQSPLAIRGVAMDAAGLPSVTINGKPAALRPTGANAAEFWSDLLPLEPGNNPIEIAASNSAHVSTKLAFTVHYTPKAAPGNPKGLEKAEIISLLVGGVPAERVAQIVKDRGVKFVPTADDLSVIRAAGGTDELIEAIQKAAPHP